MLQRMNACYLGVKRKGEVHSIINRAIKVNTSFKCLARLMPLKKALLQYQQLESKYRKNPQNIHQHTICRLFGDVLQQHPKDVYLSKCYKEAYKDKSKFYISYGLPIEHSEAFQVPTCRYLWREVEDKPV